MSGLVTFGETMAVLSSTAEGPLRHATALALGIAGTESNVAIGVRRLGLPAAWSGRVGDDELGALVLARLRGEDVDVAGATVDADAPTGLMIKERRTAAATRVSYYRRDSAASRLGPEHLDEPRVAAAAILHVTGVTAALSASARALVFAAVEVARAAGTSVSCDLNYRAALWAPQEAAPVLCDLVRRADVVFATEDEARLAVGDDAPECLAALGPGTAVVKRGRTGAVAVVAGERIEVPPVPVHAVDSVGAGDAFAAGYLCGLLDGSPAAERLRLAATMGAFAVTVRGDWEGLPSRRELGLLTEKTDVTR